MWYITDNAQWHFFCTMSPEQPHLEAKQSIRTSVVIPESFVEALKAEQPDALNLDRIDGAIAVLKGEKDAVTPKPPDPEPTESQKFFREMYQTGDKSPYKVKRGPVKFDAFKEVFSNPTSKTFGEHIMAIDKDFRGGVEIGDMKIRGMRAVVMVGNMAPNIAFDIVSSIPPNLFEKGFEEHLKVDMKTAKDKAKAEIAQTAIADKEGKVTPETQALIDGLTTKVASVRMIGRIGEVMNDKNVTALGNTIMRQLTGEKGWFTGEASDKLNDLLTAGFRDVAEDFLNGPTIESAFRILYQIPVVGALIEQGWTRWTNFQSASEYSKGNLKALYTGIGLFIGVMRDVDGKGHNTPSWWITDRVWGGGAKILRALR